MKVGGIVLCGGKSARMGRAKAWLPFGPEFLLQRVVRAVREVAGAVVVVAAPGQAVPPLPDDAGLVRDAIEDRGPLGGLSAGLTALADRCDAVYLSACDAPFLTPEFVARVADALAEAPLYSAAVPRIDGRLHPLAAAYRVSVLPVVREMLAANQLRMTDLFDRIPTRVLGAEQLAGFDANRCVRNINTPTEYQVALAAAQENEKNDGS